jgi:Family of unknown function (DUF6404)
MSSFAALFPENEVTVSDPRACDPAPEAPRTRRSFLSFVNILILVSPFAVLAAGPGAFLGMCVAVAGWGAAFLHMGAVAGAGIGVALVGVWVIVHLVRDMRPKIDPAAHAEKIASFIQDIKSRGENPDWVTPIMFRAEYLLGLHLGIQVRPPLFMGFWSNFLRIAGLFGALCLWAGAVYWWEHPNSPPWAICLTESIFLLMAVGIGAGSAAACRRQARKYQLPLWDNYTPPASPELPVDENTKN